MHDEDVVMIIASMHSSCVRRQGSGNDTNTNREDKSDINRNVHKQFFSRNYNNCKMRKPKKSPIRPKKVKDKRGFFKAIKKDAVGKQYKSKYDACENGLIKTEVTYDSSENVQLDKNPQNNVQPQRVESSCISPNDQPHFRHKIQYTSLKDHEALCKKIAFLYNQSKSRRKFHLELFTKNLSNRAYNNKKHDAHKLNRKALPMFEDDIYDLCKVNLTPLSVFARRQYIVRAFRAKFNLQQGSNLRVMPQEVN